VLTCRELATRTGWSHAIIGEYLAGTALPPTDRFDQLVQLLGATRAELGPLASARDRVEEVRRSGRVAPAAPPAALRVPRELPARVGGFVGRDGPLAELDRVAASGPAGTGLPIVAICGGAGVGKTALALHWAHANATVFPDGQLYIDLHGYDSGSPVVAVEALGRFLRAFGVAADRMPSGVDERAARYRTALADRRVLVVLDNAQSAEHVRPLLPGGPGCMVVVTSQDRLAGLVAADGAYRIQLDGLAEAESIELLRALLAESAEDNAEVAALARLCGGLPAQLRAAAELAATHPEEPLALLVADLREQQGRRGPLATRSALSRSYRRIGTANRRLTHPEPSSTASLRLPVPSAAVARP